MEWQPIETLPEEFKEDGSTVLLYFPDRVVTYYTWTGMPDDRAPPDDPRWKPSEQEDKAAVFMCRWDYDRWGLAYCDDNYYYPSGEPTHWMLVPEPPKAAAAPEPVSG